MTELHRAVRRYVHDGKLIDLLGGLHSAIGRLDDLLARYAPVPQALPSPGESTASSESQEWIHALLGAIAVRNHVVQALIAPAGATSDVEPSRAAPMQESLLR